MLYMFRTLFVSI